MRPYNPTKPDHREARSSRCQRCRANSFIERSGRSLRAGRSTARAEAIGKAAARARKINPPKRHQGRIHVEGGIELTRGSSCPTEYCEAHSPNGSKLRTWDWKRLYRTRNRSSSPFLTEKMCQFQRLKNSPRSWSPTRSVSRTFLISPKSWFSKNWA